MLSDKMEKTLNDQVNAELESAYIYLAMAAYFEDTNFPGFALWMHLQAQEEVDHAMRIYNYVFERRGRVKLAEIPAPPVAWESPLDAFEAAYKHECKISDMIDKIVTLARKENDHATDNFFQWFVAEQVEEEASTDAVVQKLKLIDGNPSGLFMLDRELGARQPEDED